MGQLLAFNELAKTISGLAADPETCWSFGSDVRPDGSTHALEEMRNDGIEFSDVVYVLKKCRVVRSQNVAKFKEVRHRVVGRNVDGIKMVFIVTLRERAIEIVTAWVAK